MPILNVFAFSVLGQNDPKKYAENTYLKEAAMKNPIADYFWKRNGNKNKFSLRNTELRKNLLNSKGHGKKRGQLYETQSPHRLEV